MYNMTVSSNFEILRHSTLSHLLLLSKLNTIITSETLKSWPTYICRGCRKRKSRYMYNVSYQPLYDGDSVLGTSLQLLECILTVRVHRPYWIEVLREFPSHRERVVVGDVEGGLSIAGCAVFLVKFIKW